MYTTKINALTLLHIDSNNRSPHTTSQSQNYQSHLKSRLNWLYIHYSLQMFHFHDGLILNSFFENNNFCNNSMTFYHKKIRYNLNQSIETSKNRIILTLVSIKRYVVEEDDDILFEK